MTFPRLLAAIAVTALSCGCAPVIAQLAVGPAEEGQTISVSATLKPYLTVVRTPQLGVGPYPPEEGPYQNAGTLALASDGEYEGVMAAQDYGAYELKLSVPCVQALFPIARGTRYRYTTFYVDGPSSCFTFDGDGVGAAGWSVDGVYDGDRPDKVADPVLNLLWRESTNWPEPINGAMTDDDRGAIGFEIDPLQIPFNDALYQTDYWCVDLRSPGLESEAQWQSMQGVSLRFVSEAIGLKVQPLVRVRKQDGSIVQLRQLDDDGALVLHEIQANTWHVIEFPFQMPADVAVVLDLEVRVFGAVSQLPFNNHLESFLDGVCAM